MDVGLVCDACSALTPIGVPQCTRCGASVALDPRPRGKKSRPPPPDPETVDCGKCGMNVAAGTRFCPNCGARIVIQSFDVETRVGPRPSGVQPNARPGSKSGGARSTLFFGGAHQSARAKLTLIRGDGEDGVSFTLAGDEHLAGRGE